MPFKAEAPSTLGTGRQGPLSRQLRRICGDVGTMLIYTVKPFNPAPEPPDDPPPGRVGKDQLAQCQKMFDDTEASRDSLEAKARATFSVISFLAPLTASIFVFLLSRSTAAHDTLLVAKVFAGAAAFLMILAFVSIARAVSVQQREALGLQAVIDYDRSKFRPYNRSFHARGLIYCASVNQAMNAHIAQFVKGAHVFATVAVLALIVAALPTGLILVTERQTTKTELTGPVVISSSDIMEMRKETAAIGASLAKIALDRSGQSDLAALNATLGRVAAELAAIRLQLERRPVLVPEPPGQPAR